ncbi:unnamed protein product [Ectocarpus fasciculatus]
MGTSGMPGWGADRTAAAASTHASSKMFVASMAVLILLSGKRLCFTEERTHHSTYSARTSRPVKMDVLLTDAGRHTYLVRRPTRWHPLILVSFSSRGGPRTLVPLSATAGTMAPAAVPVSATASPAPTTAATYATAAPSSASTAEIVTTCSNGVPGVENGMGTVCCPIECGDFCGGSGCGTVDATNCCASSIVGSNVDCDVSEEAPCVISDSSSAFESATCSNGVTGVENEMGTVCCPIECGDVCGGDECVVNALLCCASSITDSDVYCDEAGEAPCIIGSASDTPPPVAMLLPTPTPAPGETMGPPTNSSSGGSADPATVPPTTTPAEVSSEEDDDTPQTLSIVGAAVCGALASAVFVLTCVGLKSHCATEGKSIRQSLEVLCGKGSFWSAMFVLCGVLVALNVFSLGWVWGAVSVFASVVLIFVVVAWFVAFKTGTPATVSLQCACCICPYKPSSFSLGNEQACPHREESVSQNSPHEEAPAWEEERGVASSASSDCKIEPT